ncbi:hypothetical protein [Agromyces ramosus]|uniref:Uncharacterized protein n=1 Tax=Agromyces ramosus TaxID=33879 RepID=A0ABU0R6N8_9MICO|nr:hypothetical protein [Agromyces ramosus]MDQ0893740.1 hypothetical protein [Agromyces ramosus]
MSGTTDDAAVPPESGAARDPHTAATGDPMDATDSRDPDAHGGPSLSELAADAAGAVGTAEAAERTGSHDDENGDAAPPEPAR